MSALLAQDGSHLLQQDNDLILLTTDEMTVDLRNTQVTKLIILIGES